MSQHLRYTLVSLRELLLSVGPFLLLVGALLGFTYWWLQPTPPKHLVLATGPEQSAYDSFGQAYAQALGRYGIRVELLATEGSAHNLALLRGGRADIGFVQGGSTEAQPQDAETLLSLGNLFVEPLWLFYRLDKAGVPAQAAPQQLSDLRGWRLNVGTEGSGLPRLFGALLETNRLEAKAFELSQHPPTPAVMALLAAEVDALLFASAPESPLVQMLLQTPGIGLLSFDQNEAYSRRLPYLSPVLMPQGLIDLASQLPPQDVRLLASTTRLVARSDTHPALLQLFAQTAIQQHGQAGWFSRTRQYPNLDQGELPLSGEAERAIRSGPPLLQRYLPFWLANLVERMWLAMGLILALALPLSRVLPPLYSFRIRSRVFRWYAQLRDIEQRHDASAQDSAHPAPPCSELLGALDEMEAKVEKINLPLAYTDELYALRNHIHLVRKKLLRASAAEAPDGSSAKPLPLR